MIIKLCAKCKKPVVFPNRFCDTCAEVYKQEEEENERLRNRKYYQTRDKKYLRFYGSNEWKLLKNKKLQDTQYKCEVCGKIATEVHHIKPIQTEGGWVLRLDYDNLKSVCLHCHNAFHNRFQKKERK